MNKKTIRDIDLKDRKVLVRCDFNVPLDENFKITENRRIVGALPTIKYLLDNNCKVILCSHLGRPKGEVKKEFSLAPVQKELSRLLGIEVKLADDIIGKSAKNLTENMKNGEVVLLENVRFDAREEANDREFAKELASMAEVYVNDAFGTAHRAHASTEGVSHYLPSVSGFLIEKELKFLGESLQNPERPFVAILGGAKVSDKIGVIDSLLEKVDTLIIGGGMAYTFFKAQGYEVGNSLCELDKLDLAREAMEKAKNKGVKLILPVDTKVGKEFKPDTESKTVKYTEIPADWEGFDIGDETIKLFSDEIRKAKTVVWNGPLGAFELDQFAVGTNSIAKFLGNLEGVTTIIGGGDSAVEESIYLANISKNVKIISRSEIKGKLKSELESYSNIEVIENANIEDIKFDDDVYKLIVNGKEIKANGVFSYIGFTTNIDGLYACGDIIKKSLYQIVTAVSEGAKCAVLANNYIRGLNK